METGIPVGLTVATERARLRGFGKTMGLALPLVFGLALPWVWGRPLPVWPWVAGVLFGLVAWWAPRALRGPYWVWMRLGDLLHRLNTFVLFSLLFFGVVTPLGWIFRLRGRDPLRRRWEPQRASYREQRTVANLVERMDNQF